MLVCHMFRATKSAKYIIDVINKKDVYMDVNVFFEYNPVGHDGFHIVSSEDRVMKVTTCYGQ